MATIQEILSHCGSLEVAEEIARKAGSVLDLNLILQSQGKWAESIALMADYAPRSQRDIYANGLTTIMAGNLRKGIWEFHQGRDAGVFASPRMMPGPLYSPEIDVSGKAVLLHGEGGLGDQIINVRFAKVLADRGANVIVTCHDSLVSVFDRVEGVSKSYSHGSPIEYDYWLPCMSAPMFLDIGFDRLPNEPYLTALEPSGSGKVGIRWSGNPQFEHEQYRAIAESDLRSIVPDGVSLHPESGELDLSTWDKTLNELAGMELVVTTCTSIAHAAGALGVKTLVLVPVMPYYVWAYPMGDKSAWYSDNVTIYRQREFMRWDMEEISNVVQSLRN